MRKRKRFAAMVCCASMSACGATAPSSTALDGQWRGTTSQGTPITFTVSSDQKVSAITVGYNFSGCSGTKTFSNLSLETASPMATCVPAPCSSTLTSFRGFGYSDGSVEGGFTNVNGLFPAMTRAEGAVGFLNYPGCGTALGVSWTATRP